MLVTPELWVIWLPQYRHPLYQCPSMKSWYKSVGSRLSGTESQRIGSQVVGSLLYYCKPVPPYQVGNRHKQPSICR